jgi:hypothetical protein
MGIHVDSSASALVNIVINCHVPYLDELRNCYLLRKTLLHRVSSLHGNN